MSHWGGWDWIAYGCLGISALGLAVGVLWREQPYMFEWLPTIFSKPFWSILPAILFVVATVIFLARLFASDVPQTAKTLQGSGFTFIDKPPEKMIANKTFRNERVLLDGMDYRDCTFINVTLVFNGTAPFAMSGSNFQGIFVASDNPSVNGAFLLFYGIGFLVPGLKIDAPPGFRVTPPKNADASSPR